MRKIPPLNSLRAFEAAARHMSFSKAADELCVTATAISHQIKLLEETIGLPLFRRMPRPMTLTQAGERLFPTVRDSFDRIAKVVEAVKHDEGKQLLRVSTTLAFASGVLLPQLKDWAKHHPDIELEVHASDYPIDFASENIDLAVRYLRKPQAGMLSEELCSDHYLPMLSPSLLEGVTQTDFETALIFKLPLITYRWKQPDPAQPKWEKWCQLALDQNDPSTCLSKAQTLRLSEESHAIEAAASGQGVVLASAIVTRKWRANKRLVPASNIALPGLSYFLVHASHLSGDPRVAKFRDWLMRILQDDEALNPYVAQ